MSAIGSTRLAESGFVPGGRTVQVTSYADVSSVAFMEAFSLGSSAGRHQSQLQKLLLQSRPARRRLKRVRQEMDANVLLHQTIDEFVLENHLRSAAYQLEHAGSLAERLVLARDICQLLESINVLIVPQDPGRWSPHRALDLGEDYDLTTQAGFEAQVERNLALQFDIERQLAEASRKLVTQRSGFSTDGNDDEAK